MARFFPHSSHVREAREVFWSEGLSEAQVIIAGDALESPRACDWREMIEEYCTLLEDLGVPDRDGADVGVIVPVVWSGQRGTRLISVDIGRRALAFARQPENAPGEVTNHVFLEDADLAKNLRDALVPVLLTYKNENPSSSTEPT